MSTITAFAAALLAVNAGKIKSLFDELNQEIKKPGSKPIQKCKAFDLSEDLIQKLAKKTRNLFKLPPMQENPRRVYRRVLKFCMGF